MDKVREFIKPLFAQLQIGAFLALQRGNLLLFEWRPRRTRTDVKVNMSIALRAAQQGEIYPHRASRCRNRPRDSLNDLKQMMPFFE